MRSATQRARVRPKRSGSVRATIHSTASRTAVEERLRRTDAVSEVHDTIRAGAPVERVGERRSR
jgi:hypothetical protein